MKTARLLFGVVLLAALLSCGRAKPGFCPPATPAGSTLASIDSLMGRHPDSAFALLQEFTVNPEADSLDVFSRHYCQLMVSELLYRNDCGQSNRDAVLKARPYFDSLSEAFPKDPALALLSARAHYMKGVGYYERDSVTEACREYLQALEIMEGRFEEKELVGQKARFMALIYTHLTELFSDLYLHEQAICFGRKALDYYGKIKNSPSHLAWMLDEIGAQYEMMEQLDSADCYYLKAAVGLNDTGSLIYRDIAIHGACLSYKRTKNTQLPLFQLRKLLAQSEDEREYLARCLAMGDVFYHETQYDSAWLYLKRVYSGTTSVGAKKQAAEWLLEICRKQGRAPEMSEYAVFLAPFANQAENNSACKSQLVALYNAYTHERSDRLRRQEISRGEKWTMLALGGNLLLALAVVLLFYMSRKRKRCLEARNNADR